MNLRRGVPEDRDALNAVALAAKAHWGYAPEQLEAWRRDLEVDPESLCERPVLVAEDDGEVVGFAQVATDTEPWELWALWVDPAHMGRGIGAALLDWVCEFAAAAGCSELAIDSDPNAESFYLARGARRVGVVSAPITGQPERVRPQLRLRTGVAFPFAPADPPRQTP